MSEPTSSPHPSRIGPTPWRAFFYGLLTTAAGGALIAFAIANMNPSFRNGPNDDGWIVLAGAGFLAPLIAGIGIAIYGWRKRWSPAAIGRFTLGLLLPYACLVLWMKTRRY